MTQDVLRVTLREDGTVELWSDRERPASEVAAILRSMARSCEDGSARRIS